MGEKDRLVEVLKTLNTIEVKGRDNLNRLLGCILVLEAEIQARNPEENTVTED